MWLQRSASLPLFLSFRIAIASSDAAQSLIDACLIHHRRWRELELFSELSTDGAVRVDCADKEFPLLRKVTLRSWGDVSWGAIIIQNAPMLREAYVEGIFDMRLPWSQLAQLSLFTYDSAADCLPILTQCSDLLLHLVHETILPQPVTNLFNEPHFTLNSLDSLKVNGSAIVPHLTLPRLRNLVLSRNIAVAIEPFQALFCRSNCSLQQLTVVADRYDSKLNPPTLLSLFQLVPTLTDLTLDLQSVAVHQVITSLSSPNTLPALATLLIVAYRVRDEYDDLLAVLRSRHANNTLKCFSLTLRPHKDAASPEPTSPLPQAALAHFRDLADGGLQCRIVLERKPWPLVLLDTFAPSVLLAEVFLQPSS
ncbi:hypothetical protein DFH06DRAFT_1044494 [Mycena polygramma]|nr:hypothetical protein DFH06DRAFT_1044494 [Mycena polygramma]